MSLNVSHHLRRCRSDDNDRVPLLGGLMAWRAACMSVALSSPCQVLLLVVMQCMTRAGMSPGSCWMTGWGAMAAAGRSCSTGRAPASGKLGEAPAADVATGVGGPPSSLVSKSSRSPGDAWGRLKLAPVCCAADAGVAVKGTAGEDAMPCSMAALSRSSTPGPTAGGVGRVGIRLSTGVMLLPCADRTATALWPKLCGLGLWDDGGWSGSLQKKSGASGKSFNWWDDPKWIHLKSEAACNEHQPKRSKHSANLGHKLRAS